MAQGRLLDIAIREFGSKGLEGVSTRELAAAAGTAMSSITYHFGGKEGLYLAAADHIAERMAEAMGPALGSSEPPEDPAEARRLLHEMLEHFLTKCLLDTEAELGLFIAREQSSPTEAFERLYAGPMGLLAERLATLVRVAAGVDDQSARRVGVTLLGQVIVWRSARALAQRMTAGADDRDAVLRQTRFNADAILDRLIAARQEPK